MQNQPLTEAQLLSHKYLLTKTPFWVGFIHLSVLMLMSMLILIIASALSIYLAKWAYFNPAWGVDDSLTIGLAKTLLGVLFFALPMYLIMGKVEEFAFTSVNTWFKKWIVRRFPKTEAK